MARSTGRSGLYKTRATLCNLRGRRFRRSVWPARFPKDGRKHIAGHSSNGEEKWQSLGRLWATTSRKRAAVTNFNRFPLGGLRVNPDERFRPVENKKKNPPFSYDVAMAQMVAYHRLWRRLTFDALPPIVFLFSRALVSSRTWLLFSVYSIW